MRSCCPSMNIEPFPPPCLSILTWPMDSTGILPIGFFSKIFFVLTNFSRVVLRWFLVLGACMSMLPLRNAMASKVCIPSVSLAFMTSPGSPQSFHGPYTTGICDVYHTVHNRPPYSPVAFPQEYPQIVSVPSAIVQTIVLASSV